LHNGYTHFTNWLSAAPRSLLSRDRKAR